jgi:hypothetical protein
MISRITTLIFRGLRGKTSTAFFFVLLLGSLALGIVLFLYSFLIGGSLSLDAIPALMCAVPVSIFVVMGVMATQAARMLRCWHDAQEELAYEIVMQHLFGADPPMITASKGKLSLWELPAGDPERITTEILLNAGIPATLSVDADTAIFTQMFGKPHPLSVKTAGYHMLMPFEQIRAVHDLRDRIAVAEKPVETRTKDGIPVGFSLTVGFHIRRRDEGDDADDLDILGEVEPPPPHQQAPPSFPARLLNALLLRSADADDDDEGLPEDLFAFMDPFPVDTQALHQVVYNRSVFQSKESSLEETAVNMVKGFVRGVVARYTFSQIFDHSMPDDEPVSLGELSREIAEEAKAAVASQGLTLAFASVQLAEGTPAGVFEQIQKHWQRQREKQLETFLNETDTRNLAARMDILLQHLKSQGYDERSLPELRKMVNEFAQLRRAIDWLTGKQDYDRYGLYELSSSSRIEPGDPNDAMSEGRLAHRQNKIEEARREAFSGEKDPIDDALDALVQREFGSKYTRPE